MIHNLDLQRQFLVIGAEVRAALEKCFSHQQWIMGPEVSEFEGAIGSMIGAESCIGVSSGTEALVLGLRAIAIRKYGKEFFSKDQKIITTPFTFTATGGAILRSGATPLFVDIDPETYNINADEVEEALSAHPDVVAILPVHLYGKPCNIQKIALLAKKYEIDVVEDCAQAFGATVQGKSVGTFGALGALSFFPSKTLGAFGDAGMCIANNPEYVEIVRMLLKHGGKDKYNALHIGYNARLDTLQAAILLAKLKFATAWFQSRRTIAQFYSDNLSEVDGITLPKEEKNTEHAFHQYTVRISSGHRNSLVQHLKSAGISSMIYYPVPLHKMAVFEGHATAFTSLTHAENAVGEVLSLPIDPLLSNEEMSRVVIGIKDFFKK